VTTRQAGFTLVELLVVLVLIAIGSAVVSLSLRDPSAMRLEQEGARLAALLESARAEARASGLAVRWLPRAEREGTSGFRFIGLPPSEEMPVQWLDPEVSAEVVGAPLAVLGPEPMIGAQRIVLTLGEQRLTLATDGLGPFAVLDDNPGPP